MEKRSFVTVFLCLFLLTGCGTTKQWVKEYVEQQATIAKMDTRERLQPLEQALDNNNMQVKKLVGSINGLDVRLNQFTEKLVRFTESLEEVNKSYKQGLKDVELAMQQETTQVTKKMKTLDTKLQRLGKGLITFQRSMELLEKKLDEAKKMEGSPIISDD